LALSILENRNSLKLPYVSEDLAGIGGRIRESLGNFVVEELPLYEPEERGSHLFLNITRQGITTRELVNRLARLFCVKRCDLGYAGLKDKYSMATQTFSVPVGEAPEKCIDEFSEIIRSELPVEVNWVKLHRRKLRLGHLLGNRFSIKITGIEIDIDEALHRARRIASKLKDVGVPNYYGPQRLGGEGKNLRRGLEIIQGKRHFHRGWLRRYLISCYLSHLCNKYLERRIESGDYYCMLKGDIAKKYSTGGMFMVEDTILEQARFQQHEISFTAPIFGPKMWRASGPSAMMEEEVWGDSGISLEQLKRLGVRGTRRLGRVIPTVEVKSTNDGLLLNFTLSKGAFATTVLREIMKN